MHFSRVMFSGACFLVLLLLFSLGTSGGDEKPKMKFVSVLCQTTVDVDITVGVKQADIYVCKGSKVTWKQGNSHKFTVIFKRKQCPFTGGCKDIDQDTPTSTPVKDLTYLTVFDYEILVDGELFDPHVVGGGGP